MKKYWKSQQEKNESPEIKQVKHIPKGNLEQVLDIFEDGTAETKSNRRDFLKLCGYSLAITTVLSSCENAVQKAIPYLNKPEEITPGIANYYASTYINGSDYASILIKTREGRPIKIEGNNLSPISNGACSARTQASVLSLYDNSRYQSPQINQKQVPWAEFDESILKALNSQKDNQIALLTPTIFSPSTRKAIQQFTDTYPNIKWVQYDTQSASAILRAQKLCFDKNGLPNYRFNKANLIVSFDADFLGTWLNPAEYIKTYSDTRKLSGSLNKMSRHIQFESRMSLTGSNADERHAIKPSELNLLIAQLYNEILILKGQQKNNVPEPTKVIKELAKDLLDQKSRSLVVSGSRNLNAQILINAINYELENFNSSINMDTPLLNHQAIDEDMDQLIDNLASGQIKGLICYHTNPVYSHPKGEKLKKAIESLSFSLSIHETPNETTSLMKYIAPDNHYLESWNDAEIKKDSYSLMQPAIHPLFDTRQFQASLLKWSGEDVDYHKFIMKHWEETLFPSQTLYTNFKSYWEHTLQEGIFQTKAVTGNKLKFAELDIIKILEAITQKKKTNRIELQVYEKVTIGDGSMANNPWLQEMPDPISKICWDNYLNISPKQAKELGLETGNMVKLNGDLELPVYILPGQAYNTVSIAIGYGRTICGKVGKDVGFKASHLNTNQHSSVKLEKVEGHFDFAMTQTHHSMEGRAIVREANLDEYKKNPKAGNDHKHEYKNAGIYKEPEFPNHHWGLAIDLNACIGCGACTIACQAENNVPIVGKKEVIRAHEMSWIRIDRYFSGDENKPGVVFQPVMCQHCDNAPCENVCPVAATNHSSEGLNQMIYNRCIGTRYCGNNCPYKVRRFNWFDYTQADSIPNNLHDPAGMTLDLSRMVLNPDVTIRAKGVIEKCSMCVQRIQEGKLNAKLEGRKVKDGDINTACQQTCPSGAILFGDLNDKASDLFKVASSDRNYHLLEEIHTLPSVSYLTRIRNKKS
ncbi:4Fe-4S dicluster domain-containing protein [Ancylomarina euxinus]|uniref:4Fe-4S dicluster domain-containing protein n=1 Tax=Ancylomarina euxinus TaxID=2283627 RepID=A0A425Y327_9BACT|nr:Fe-S-cluster-containing hydrogenase [Ancylomarina euxinus]MCZ4693161.1 Fe-S-cluster-containing hydrogenase [Ancylomarina euxinus]MUP15299.1 4Fe-4S dicluster domain-containing protein [Ancylomarina euxinus]RRG22572.1 4Fe-4S dicluster domain-containing protein [Ancylomarina euxinus]